MVSIIILIGVFAGAREILSGTDSRKNDFKNSQNYINTINQVGDNLQINNQYPRPTIESKILISNEPREGKYYSQWEVEYVSTPGVSLSNFGSTGIPNKYKKDCNLDKKTDGGRAFKFMNGTTYSSFSFFVTCLTDEPLNTNIVKFFL